MSAIFYNFLQFKLNSYSMIYLSFLNNNFLNNFDNFKSHNFSLNFHLYTQTKRDFNLLKKKKKINKHESNNRKKS